MTAATTRPARGAVGDRRDAAIVRRLAAWFERSARPLPWRTHPRDPYRTLVSEFLLQQTQASRAAERYLAIVTRWPTIDALARARPDELLRLWAGLGYYARAHRLHATARQIVRHHAGRIPSDPRALRALPGVGPYTAGAVASIAFGLPVPAVDANVARVLTRCQGWTTAQGDRLVRRRVDQFAGRLVRCAAKNPGAGRLNEALIELGALVCTPRAPDCRRCPLQRLCRGRERFVHPAGPVVAARPHRAELRCDAFVVVDRRGLVLVEPRANHGLWPGLWQVPTLECRPGVVHGSRTILRDLARPRRPVARFVHPTSHRLVRFRVFRIPPERAGRARAAAGCLARWCAPGRICTLPLPSPQLRILQLLGLVPVAQQPARRAQLSQRH